MTQNLTETLDLALERWRTGESLPTILADFPAEAETLRPLLEAAACLTTLPPVELPSPAALQVDRADFLAEVARLQQQPVSVNPLVRLKEQVIHALPWSTLNLTNPRKEQRRMSALLLKVAVVFTLLFGSAGTTAALAANSLPDSPLYPVKLALEEARLAITTDPAQLGQLHLSMAQIRTQEMAQLVLKGEQPDAAVADRLQLHLNQALRLAGELPDEAMAGLLTQTRQMVQTQTQQLIQTQAQVSEPLQEPLRQAARLLNQAGQEAEAGLQDPLTFRYRFGRNRPEDAPPQPEPEPGRGRAAEPTEEPLPPEEPEPTTEPTTEPVVQPNCPGGNCDQNQYGHDSDTLPGHYGQPCATPGECEPAGDKHKYGQEPEVEPGQYGENCATPGECEPAGDKHKYGQENGESPGPAESQPQPEPPAGPPTDTPPATGTTPANDSPGGDESQNSGGDDHNDSDDHGGGGDSGSNHSGGKH